MASTTCDVISIECVARYTCNDIIKQNYGLPFVELVVVVVVVIDVVVVVVVLFFFMHHTCDKKGQKNDVSEYD